MQVVEFFSQPIWQRLALTLMHFLWQGLAVAVVVCAAVRLVGLKRGNPRYTAYLVAFAVMAGCPAVTFVALGRFAEPADAIAAASHETESPGPLSHSVSSEVAIRLSESGGSVTVTSPAPLRARLHDAWSVSLPWVLLCWMGGVIILSVRLLLGFIGVCRWRRNLEPLTPGLE
jgi:hypothetical protein